MHPSESMSASAWVQRAVVTDCDKMITFCVKKEGLLPAPRTVLSIRGLVSPAPRAFLSVRGLVSPAPRAFLPVRGLVKPAPRTFLPVRGLRSVLSVARF